LGFEGGEDFVAPSLGGMGAVVAASVACRCAEAVAMGDSEVSLCECVKRNSIVSTSAAAATALRKVNMVYPLRPRHQPHRSSQRQTRPLFAASSM
jgi:hypothetical protein